MDVVVEPGRHGAERVFGINGRCTIAHLEPATYLIDFYQCKPDGYTL